MRPVQWGRWERPEAVEQMIDVAALDLHMPGADSVKVATCLRAELPGCKVLIVTVTGGPAT